MHIHIPCRISHRLLSLYAHSSGILCEPEGLWESVFPKMHHTIHRKVLRLQVPHYIPGIGLAVLVVLSSAVLVLAVSVVLAPILLSIVPVLSGFPVLRRRVVAFFHSPHCLFEQIPTYLQILFPVSDFLHFCGSVFFSIIEIFFSQFAVQFVLFLLFFLDRLFTDSFAVETSSLDTHILHPSLP